MNRRFSLLVACVLAFALAACGDDDVTPPPTDIDAGSVDAGTDASLDAARADAGACTDNDGDGHGAMPCDDDCDDNDPSRFPGNTEVCDGDDEDCNDATFGPDGDGDTFVSTLCCNGPDNCGSDCNDTLNTVNPGAAEQCNGGIDDNCNGLADAADGVCVPCPSGLRGFDGACEDINECIAGTAACDQDPEATCENTMGGFICRCPAGYEGDGRGGGGCVLIDECTSTTSPDDCDDSPAATCMNTDPGFTCTCPVAFLGTGHGPTGCDAPRFTDLGGGVVRDNSSSGLEWQQATTGPWNLSVAFTQCSSLTLDGGGWRLPTITELESIVDPMRSPAIDTAIFPGTESARYWSSTRDGSSNRFGVDFSSGARTSIDPMFAVEYLRCVR